MSMNAALKRLGFRRDIDYRLIQAAGEPAPVLTWLSASPQPSPEAIAAAEQEAIDAAYRDARAAAYTAQLGKDPNPTPIRTIGDVLDAVMRQTEINRVAAGADADPDFAAMLTKIAGIKADHPKPGE